MVRLAAGIAAALVGIITVITAYDVFMRYVLNKPSLWRLDTTLIFLLVVMFLSAGYVEQKRAHIRIRVITDALPIRVRRVLAIVSNFLCVGICALLAYGGWLMVHQAQITHELSDMLIFPMAPIKACFIVGVTLWALAFITENYELISSPAGKQ